MQLLSVGWQDGNDQPKAHQVNEDGHENEQERGFTFRGRQNLGLLRTGGLLEPRFLHQGLSVNSVRLAVALLPWQTYLKQFKGRPEM